MFLCSRKFLFFVLLMMLARLGCASDIWDAPAFTVDAATLRDASQAVQAQKHMQATVLLNDSHFSFDETGRAVEMWHQIYRIETQEGVENWAETSGTWEAWHQTKPEIKARVITPDGAVHWLDQSTLSDFPVHEDAPDTYSDQRKYGGPLPAVTPGAIVEEQVVIRDTSPLFSAGTVHRWGFGWHVPVNKTRFILSHAASVPLKYEVHLLPNATVSTSTDNGIETITLSQGPLPAFNEEDRNVPPDIVLYPEVEFSTGTSWSQVAAEYTRLWESKIRLADVRTVTSGKNLKGSRDEVIRALVSLLHSNIRYTGVEFGESSLIPQFPSETLKRKYGDCKDKATFLVALLRNAGISANLALLETGPGRDINSKMPGMGMFDHAIVYVPNAGSEPEIWIDATARYSQVGTLPWMDYGRWALIVSDKTEALKQIPNITAEQNVHREIREFTLAEYGPARITEVDEEDGPADADNREYYGGDTKQVRKDSEAYVKDAYLADALTSLDHPDLDDLNKRASIKFVATGRRGNTDLNTAVAAIRTEALFNHLPKYFKSKDDDTSSEQQEESDEGKSRKVDWALTPFIEEWRYKVIAPIGFKLRALPPSKTEKIGTLTFTQQYSANSDANIVDGVLRVENETTRLTVQEGKELQVAVLKARSADPIFITFDSVGHSLVAAGRMKEALAAYRQVAAIHPHEALHQVQLARALLSAGLGEESRNVAKEATMLEPHSALAFSTLGWVLQNDLIGRSVKKGMDYDGSITAYRKAISLDPKDKETIASLAILLEYDSEGTRYSEAAHLKEAVAELRKLKDIDESYGRDYDENILYDLWYAHDYQGVLDYAASLQSNDVRRGLVIAATAALHGPDAAIKKSVEITTNNESRGKALVTAGAVLVRVRKYSEGAAMFTEGARGQSNESQLMRSASIFSNTKPYEQVQTESSDDPRSVVQQLFAGMLSGKLTLKQFQSITYRSSLDDRESLNEKQFHQMVAKIRSQLGGTGFPLITIADLALSNMHYIVDGDDSLGYKITIEATGAPAQDVYVVRDSGAYKLAAYSPSDTVAPEDLAWLALNELDNNNLSATRKWLDRARDKIHASTGDDPLSGATFAYFWNKGQESTATEMRTAALVLLPSKELKGPNLDALKQARSAAKSDIDRARLSLVIAYAYSAQERWKEMLPITEELTKSFPNSLRAFNLQVTALIGSMRLSDWSQLVEERIAKYSDEFAYVRSSVELAVYQGQFVKAREILKSIMDRGQASSTDLNSYAWDALLLPGPVDQGAIEAAMRANDLSKGNFAILHTLGCVYAAAGQGSQARESLLKALDSLQLEEPNSELWFGFGMIAEQYGEHAAALSMYARVEKSSSAYPGTTYKLAQLHVNALKGSSSNVANARKPEVDGSK